MAVDRDRWLGPLYKIPDWPCPTCQTGRLRPVNESFVENLSAKGRRAQSDPEGEMEHEKRFLAYLLCDNPDCKEVAVISGETSVLEVEDDEGGWGIADGYNIRNFQPSPLPFPVSPKIPEEVAAEIRAAAKLYWVDAEASANKLRQAIEVFLNERGVTRKGVNKKGKRFEIPLHQRITKYGEKRAHDAVLLWAAKWLGNEGSHSSAEGLRPSDVIDGFEFLEHVFDEAYIRTKVSLLSRAKKINRHKGPHRDRARRRRRNP